MGLEPNLQYLNPIVASLSCVDLITSQQWLVTSSFGGGLVLDPTGQIPQLGLTVGAQYLSMSYEKNVSRRVLHP